MGQLTICFHLSDCQFCQQVSSRCISLPGQSYGGLLEHPLGGRSLRRCPRVLRVGRQELDQEAEAVLGEDDCPTLGLAGEVGQDGHHLVLGKQGGVGALLDHLDQCLSRVIGLHGRNGGDLHEGEVGESSGDQQEGVVTRLDPRQLGQLLHNWRNLLP